MVQTGGAEAPSLVVTEPMRVLVVDDSRAQRRILISSLRRWGFEVAEAGSGEEALALCPGFDPDLVLSDWMMTGMDGLEFCRTFRRLPRDRYGYFVLLTSKNDKEAVALGLDCGADDFLTKPVNAPELRARITAGQRILLMQRELTEKNTQIEAALQELQTVYNALDSDLLEARKLQQSLVRETERDFGAAQLSLLLHPCGHVGGDLVGQYPISADRIGLFAIDVSGHGISSALMTARLAGYLSSTVPDQNIALIRQADGTFQGDAPVNVVRRLNDLVLREMETEHYFTLLLAEVDLRSGRLTLVQAGQPHPLLQRADGRIETLGAGGLPVGLLEGAVFEQQSYQLAPGDRFLIQSDGITECTDPGGRMLDSDGLSALMKELSALRGRAFFEALMARLSQHAGRDVFDDDVSAILLEYQGPEELVLQQVVQRAGQEMAIPGVVEKG